MTYLEDLFSVSGKTALVTGAATGIGRMIATALAQAGARVLIGSRKGADCERTAEEINALGGPGSVEGFAADVSTEAGIAALVEEVKGRTERLHILVNNAGVSWGEPLETFPYHAWAKVLNINVTAVFHLTRELLPLLEKAASDDDPARVVNLGSIMGTQPLGRRRLFLHRLQGRRAPSDENAGDRVRRPPHHRQRLRAGPLPKPHDGLRHRHGRRQGQGRQPCAVGTHRTPR
jgi:NAD(P)-dependent dehydrogenase (short-subunit alcohol dehydrogenase family)